MIILDESYGEDIARPIGVLFALFGMKDDWSVRYVLIRS